MPLLTFFFSTVAVMQRTVSVPMAESIRKHLGIKHLNSLVFSGVLYIENSTLI